MPDLTLHPTAARETPADLGPEIERLETLLAERRRELVGLQDEMREFKARYTQTVGRLLAELSEIEGEIREAERRTLGIEEAEAEEGDEFEGTADDASEAKALPVGKTLRKLFWSVAKMFHPDHAADELEARRRHAVMAEANRAYREGDVESLHTLLGDEELQSFCALPHDPEAGDDPAARLLSLKEELRTVEFGIKRSKQDGMYALKLRVEEEARRGQDLLAGMADGINRKIVKARNRLAHLS